MSSDVESPTWVTSHQAGLPGLAVRRCRLEVVSGPDAGLVLEFAQPVALGLEPQLAVQPRHLGVGQRQIGADPAEQDRRLRDLESTNGTHVKGVRVVEAFIPPGATIAIGKSAVVFTPLPDTVALPLWTEPRLGGLIGGAPAMRHLFELIEVRAPGRPTRRVALAAGSDQVPGVQSIPM